MKYTYGDLIKALNKKIDALKQEIIEEVFKENPDYQRIDWMKLIIKAHEEAIKELKTEEDTL